MHRPTNTLSKLRRRYITFVNISKAKMASSTSILQWISIHHVRCKKAVDSAMFKYSNKHMTTKCDYKRHLQKAKMPNKPQHVSKCNEISILQRIRCLRKYQQRWWPQILSHRITRKRGRRFVCSIPSDSVHGRDAVLERKQPCYYTILPMRSKNIKTTTK